MRIIPSALGLVHYETEKTYRIQIHSFRNNYMVSGRDTFCLAVIRIRFNDNSNILNAERLCKKKWDVHSVDPNTVWRESTEYNGRSQICLMVLKVTNHLKKKKKKK